MTEELIQEEMAKRERKGNCLFVFARVCKPWRRPKLKNLVRILVHLPPPPSSSARRLAAAPR